MKGTSRLLYILTKGEKDPEIVYASFLLATSAAAMGSKVTIFFIGEGVTALKKSMNEIIRVTNLPPLSLVIDQALKANVRLEVSDESCLIRGLDGRDLISTVEIVGATTLNDLIIQSDKVISF